MHDLVLVNVSASAFSVCVSLVSSSPVRPKTSSLAASALSVARGGWGEARGGRQAANQRGQRAAIGQWDGVLPLANKGRSGTLLVWTSTQAPLRSFSRQSRLASRS